MLAVSDICLVIRLRGNCIDAYNAIYWKYHKPLYRNILKLTRDFIVTEDILQEVFLTLWEKRLDIDPSKEVSNWLFRISYNKSITYLKKNLREQLIFSPQIAIEDMMENRENNLDENRLVILENAMNGLSPQKKKVFELCKLQGKTYQEVAQELDISKHTIKEYLSLAIISIKEYIKVHPLQVVILILFSAFSSNIQLCLAKPFL